TGTSPVSILYFNNPGSVQVLTGTLSLPGGTNSGGVFNPSAGAAINFASGARTFDSSATLTGAGANRITGGTVTINGAITAQNLELAGGTLNGTGSITPTLLWTGGSMSGNGTLTIPAGAGLNVSS